MPEFPTHIYTPRETENLPGIVYDSANKRNMYSEDFQNLGGEINAIENALGENLANVQAPLGFTPENVANKKTGLSDNSDTFYPSQKAVKTAVDSKQNSLGFTPENVSNKATDLTSPDNTKYPTTQAVQNAITNAVAGLLDYRGGYDASGNAFPTSGGSGTAGAILKGDFWFITVVGTLGGVAVKVGDMLVANVDTPGSTSANWDIISTELGYTPENVANKSTSVSTDQASNTKYPSVKSVYDWAVGLFQTALGFTPEDVANKDTDGTLSANSDTKYPSQKAVKTYVDAHSGGVPKLLFSTIFETAGRTNDNNSGGGATYTFNSQGMKLDTSSGSGGYLQRILAGAMSYMDLGSPSVSIYVACNLDSSGGAAGDAFFGLGVPDLSGAGIDFTKKHIGFKIVIVAGVATLYATQADGTTETVSSALTTLGYNDELDLIIVYTTASTCSYYWRKNGGALSSAVVLTTHLPSSPQSAISWNLTNKNTAFDHVVKIQASSYQR